VQYTTHGGSTYTVAAAALGGNTATYTITGLTASTAYDVQVLTVNATAPSGVAASLTNISTAAPTLAVPGAVTGLAVSTATTTSLPLIWTAPSTGGAVANYTVQYRLTGTGSYTVASAVVVASATSYTITGLTAGTAYDVQVFATNASGSGTAATLTNTSTAAGVSVPGAITGLTLGSTTSTTLPLTWTLPTTGGAITNITVQYRTPSGSGNYTIFSAVVSPTATSTTITGLTASTAYDVQVFATNSAGSGTAAQLTNVSTAAGVTAPGAITGLTLGTATTTTLPLTWTNPTTGGAVTAITVQYRTPSGSGSYTVASNAVSASATSYTISGLTAGTAYDVQVFATNSAGNGTAGQLTNVSTASSGSAPGAITNLASGTITSTTVPLTWTAATTGSPTSTTVQYRLHGSGSWTTATSALSGTATSYTVTGLTAATAYDFQVYATNASGSGTVATLTNVSTISSYTAYTVTIFNNELPQNTTYSLSGDGGYISTAVTVSPSPSAVWFFTSQSATAAPAVGTTLNTSGGAQGGLANNIYYGTVPNPSSTGTWYAYAVAVNSSGVVGGTVTGASFTVTS
jgi:cellulose 1,4-beta-cellobiosidase